MVARYLAADGGCVPNRGEVSLGLITKERRRCRLTFQVANVKRPSLAASALAWGGNDVHFNAGGGQIANRETKRAINFSKIDGIYILDMLMAPANPGK
eukprot:15460777-Alexandrium_andersonii.AAC.1